MEMIRAGALRMEIQDGTLSAYLDDLPLFQGPEELFALWLEGVGDYSPGDMEMTAAREAGPGWELLTAAFRKEGALLRMDFLSREEEIRVSASITVDWPDGIPGRASLRLPWLAAFRMENGAERFPAKIGRKRSGATALQMKKLCPPPYCLEGPDGRGIGAYFPLDAANISWDPCRNFELCDIASRKDLENHCLHLRLSQTPTLAVDIRLWPLSDGWRQCFRRFREIIRARVPQDQYAREDLRWIRDTCLCHFTYAFSREFFDYESGRPDLDKLLQEGEAFGGYDCILLWHEYPRLGLDSRTQWDFYDDYPGGREGLKQLIARAHEKGVRVMLPFKPWDSTPDENSHQTTARIAALIRELDVDGIFYDTMNTVPESFRAAIDAARPGVVFVSESEPHETRALEMITCSWNQYRTDWSMPESNLIRFLFPLHTRHAISRWHMGAQKDIAIQRAVFNGEGMVIWQDIFGAWLPYSPAQKQEIARWKQLRKEFLPLLETMDCVPLLTTLAPDVHANGFFCGDKAIITLWLDGDEPWEGELISRLPYASACDRWGGQPMKMENGVLYGRLEPGKAAFVVLE